MLPLHAGLPISRAVVRRRRRTRIPTGVEQWCGLGGVSPLWSRGRWSSAEAGVGVQAFEEHVDDGEVEQDGGEPDVRQPRRSGTAPASLPAGVAVYGIEHPAHEGPNTICVAPPNTPPRT